MTNQPPPFDFSRYLTAKRTVDDRALNRQVFAALAGLVAAGGQARPLRVLEVGCGLGTMAARLVDWGLLKQARYTGVDLSAELIAAAREALPAWAATRGLAARESDPPRLLLEGPEHRLELTLETADALEYLTRPGLQAAFDLVVAHAFLDLVDLEALLPLLFASLAPGGAFYFTLNFDGGTVFWPPLDPALDERLEALYHQTMDARRVAGRATGGSRTGRQLFGLLPRCGGRIAAAGSSDWVVFAGPEGYPYDEAYFCHCIIATVEQALTGLLPERELAAWAAGRRRQIAAGQLVYLARQLDFCGVKAGGGVGRRDEP